MKITICGSLDFAYEMKEIADQLIKTGFEVRIPISAKKIINGEYSLKEIKEEKENGNFAKRVIENDSIRAYYEIIENADAILVANFDKKGVNGYIGGNSFLEIGFAHVLNKKIFLFNEIPEMDYSDEIKAMQPIVLHGDIQEIKKYSNNN